MGVSQWIPNFSQRLAQLERISPLEVFDDVEVWLGGLFYPEAYVTATRQAVAHRNGWSLETLHLRLDLNQTDSHEGFVVEGSFTGSNNDRWTKA
jgi:dynein heavy chain 1